ncbi:hypothetical protein JVU11DRAFT_9788 [Chiua virens]|nr:hypothetical protein JVU11DRAFT_9788 [Chiua virens]
MSIWTNSRLFRFVLSLVRRFRLSVGRITSALRSWFASLWTSILTCARRIGQPQIRLHASDVPAAVDNSHFAEHVPMQDERSGTLAVQALPVAGQHHDATHWQDVLPEYQARFSGHQFAFQRLPATPEKASQRYQHKRVGRRPDLAPLNIQPGRKELLAVGWSRHVHPEGNVLFYHQELRIFTESNIYDPNTERELLYCATQLIQQAINMQDDTLHELTELVLIANGRDWFYYFVDHKHRLLFWVDLMSVTDFSTHLQGISQHSHIRCIVNSIPTDRTLPNGIFEDLRGMLNYAKTDMMTADSSSSPFAQDELIAISDLINSLKDDKTINNPYSIWVIARLMTYFTENQFLNFCGQPCARLDADEPLFESPKWNCRPLFRIINVLLLGSPNEHAHRLHRVWVDSMIIQPRWKDFVSRLTAELGRYTIFSTVMLAVDFSFLAVPGVVDPNSHAKPIQFLLNVYSNPGLMGAGPAAGVLRALTQARSGMACLAITHSLPMASLIWSIALFSTALAIQLFSPKQLATIVTLGTECFIIVVLAMISSFVTGMFYEHGDTGEVDTFEEMPPPPPSGKAGDPELGN